MHLYAKTLAMWLSEEICFYIHVNMKRKTMAKKKVPHCSYLREDK